MIPLLNPEQLRLRSVPTTGRTKPPRPRAGDRFLKGPIPMRWLERAAQQPGRALHVGRNRAVVLRRADQVGQDSPIAVPTIEARAGSPRRLTRTTCPRSRRARSRRTGSRPSPPRDPIGGSGRHIRGRGRPYPMSTQHSSCGSRKPSLLAHDAGTFFPRVRHCSVDPAGSFHGEEAA